MPIDQSKIMAFPTSVSRRKYNGIIPELAAAGLDGIECFHSKHSASTTQHYLEVAGRLSLLVTGGSDCHGLSKGKPLIGTIKVPYQYVERL